MIYNSQEVLLFGGQGSSTLFGNTWTWDAKYWTQRQDIGPGDRAHLALAYDSARQRAVLFGGGNQLYGSVNLKLLDDRWEEFAPSSHK